MIGRTIAHYRLIEKLGEGGMGEVYRATDTKLGRDVALKVLPEKFARDADRMARFEREAQVLAALNHPNIASLYGLEEADSTRALVMELVKGPTLAERIAQGAIALDEALPIAKQIAEAVEYAHERGVIHRDLKPANIKLTPDGTVKVLDFGLAKAFGPEETGEDIAQSPTLTAMATQAGTIMGTAAYMSPEQAKGKRVDRRADIWSFGAVLYEMLTGRPLYTGETVSEILAQVIEREPDLTALPAATPRTIREALRRCLVKDAKKRLQAIGEARIGIEEYLANPTDASMLMNAPAAAVELPTWRRGLPWAVAGVALAVSLALLLFHGQDRRESAAPRGVKRLVLSVPPEAPPISLAPARGLALSPDGNHLAYVGRLDTTRQLVLRSLSDLEVKPLAGTQGAFLPFFSPDGQWIGFFAHGKMKKVAVTGGVPLTLCNVADAAGASWAPDGTIYFVPGWVSGLYRVSAEGGRPELVTNTAPEKGERGFLWPQVLPGGEAVLLTVYTGGGIFDDARILAYSLKTGERRVLIEGGGDGRYVPTGHLLYVSGETILGVEFYAERLEVRSAPKPVLQGITLDAENGAATFAYAGDGTLVYVPGGRRLAQRRMVWVDRHGREEPLPAPLRPYDWPRLSPDGRRVAVTQEGDTYDVWLYHLERNTLSRLTFGLDDGRPTWFPDGQSIAFDSTREGANSIFRIAADGSGTVEQLTREDTLSATSISPDGRFLLYNRWDPPTASDIWLLPLAEGSPPRPLLQTPFYEEGAVFSPNGQWIAYESTETGQSEIYVRPFPGPGAKIQISTAGGDNPMWVRNGRELFYRAGRSWMVVDVALEPSFQAGSPRLLFEGPYRSNYDVSPDGQRLLVVRPEEQETIRQLHVVLNWFEELRRLVPTGE